MKLQELAVANPIQQAAKVFESYFGNRVDFNTVSKGQARDMLKRVRGLIAEHRRTPEFHYSERNPSYLKLVMMEQALAAAATTPGAANPQAQAGMQAAQIQQKKKQIQDAIKAKQGEIAQLQKQMNDPTMMAMTEAMPATDAQMDPQATRQYAQKIIQSLDRYTGQDKFEPKYNNDGTITIGKRQDQMWADDVYRKMGRNLNDPDLLRPGALTGANMNKAVGPYFDMFRSKGWRFDQPVAGQFTFGVPKSQQPAVAEGRRARRLREASEIQQAQVVLASQDMVDQVQKMSEQVSAMQFKDLPALLDQIRNEVGVDQATQYNADASAALSGLLGNLQGAKQQLEAALGVITGQAPQVPGADMAAAPDMGADMGAELPAPGEEEVADLDAAGADLDAAAQAAGLGRERR
jgi:hypothetical protein